MYAYIRLTKLIPNEAFKKPMCDGTFIISSAFDANYIVSFNCHLINLYLSGYIYRVVFIGES